MTAQTNSNEKGGEAPLLAASQHLLKDNGAISGREVGKCILPQFSTLESAIPQVSSRHALASVDGRKALTHNRIREFVMEDFGTALHGLGFGRGDRIAVILPNGPELGLAIFSLAQWGASVPLSASSTKDELIADLKRSGASLVIGPYNGKVDYDDDENEDIDEQYLISSAGNTDWSAFEHVEDAAKEASVPFVGMAPSRSEAGCFQLVMETQQQDSSFRYGDSIEYKPLRKSGEADTSPNTHDDQVLILFTSGTTGQKKLVPHCLGDILIAATVISLSWALCSTDVNCNLMPLFHVGGIVRQIFSPFLSASAVICCPRFDPDVFWELLGKKGFTWYYASPTMHQHILETGKQPASDDGDKSLLAEIKPKLRMIANAAGGLLPSTAEKLRKAFKGANILPSYGMTECMPISSPPATYELEKPGTSGVAVGPEIAIMAIDEDDCVEETPVNKEGHICVRGEPCFRGYGRSAEDETAPDTFLEDSWFDTGDLGYMDEDGYLYVTGRSKEVINRGGEIISPMEVEDAITHKDVVNACAFSAAHESLQEVVGVVLVMAKGCNRLDLSALHKHLDHKLESTKWPQCIVYMNDLPKSKTNKLLRVKLGKRFGFVENPLNDAMASNELHFEAECPPPGTSLKQSIEIQRVSVSAKKVGQLLNKRVATEDNQEVLVVDHPDRPGTLVCSVLGVDRIEAIETAQKHLDGYEVPTHFVEVGSKSDLEGARDTVSTPAPEDAVQTILQGNANPEDIDPTVQKLQKLFIDMLELDHLPSPTDSFFSLGGSSILASQLASKIRKEFGVACSGAQVFDLVSCEKLATLVNGGTRKQSSTGASDTEATGSDNTSRQGSLEVEDQMQRSKHSANFSSDHMLPKSPWIAGLFQLVPVTLVFPIWQVTRYLMFLRCVVWLVNDVPSTKDIGVFILAYIFFQLVWQTVTPLVFVVIKWAVIGRYQEGRYPINGSYYLRWWFVDVCRKLFLRGIWGWNGTMLNIYYRMLGAKIGKGARIGFEADVAEYDLVSIGEDTAIEFSTVRGFGVDNGAMLLGKVAIGDRASVGIKSIVAPNTSIPMDAHLGPAMSSYEVDDKALNPENATVNRQSLQEAKWYYQLFVGGPILFLIGAIEQLPPLAILLAMLWYKSEEGIPLETVGDLVEWLVDPSRVPFFIGIRVARTMVSPFFYMGPAILVKRLVIGKFKEGPRDKSSDWSLFKSWLAATLFSRARMQDVTNIAGRHYGVVSFLYRALGAKIGKRVYWPGQQFIFNGEYDLLEIGDDVVFGSRSAILCSTTESFEKVVLTSGCNVADNCVVYPGSIIGSKAVLASNSVCPRGWYLPERSVWFGSKGGEPVCLQTGPNNSTSPHLVEDITKSTELPFDGRASTLSPFGKATHERKATYFVWPISLLVLTTFVIKTLIAVFHSLPLLAALHAGAAWLYGLDMDQRDYRTNPRSFGEIYGAMLLMFVFANIARIYVWFILELVAKWSIMGRRKMGEYNYDESSYGQRWEIYLAICTMRQWNRMSVLDFLSGSFWMNLYWHCNGCTIGRNVCLYPAGASPYMTEPDLVSIGDNSVVDRASVVCHLNTRGNFCLKPIQIGKNCTLRAQSRVQQGVTMEDGSMLLEKSLAMTGEVVEERSVWVGTPASWWFQYEDPSVAVSSGSNDDCHA